MGSSTVTWMLGVSWNKVHWLSPVYSGHLEYICWNSLCWCTTGVTGISGYLWHSRGLPNLSMIVISENTQGLSITFGILSAWRSFKTKDYWTFSHLFHRIRPQTNRHPKCKIHNTKMATSTHTEPILWLCTVRVPPGPK